MQSLAPPISSLAMLQNIEKIAREVQFFSSLLGVFRGTVLDVSHGTGGHLGQRDTGTISGAALGPASTDVQSVAVYQKSSARRHTHRQDSHRMPRGSYLQQRIATHITVPPRGEPMRAIPILLLLAGCVTAQQQSLWLRADGRTGSARQLEMDRTICMGERQNTSEMDQVVRGCMAQRGWLPADQP
jgi:hypothetical protein